LLTAAATASSEQMLMVESVKGMPKASAALAARISPSGCCMPVAPIAKKHPGHTPLRQALEVGDFADWSHRSDSGTGELSIVPVPLRPLKPH